MTEISSLWARIFKKGNNNKQNVTAIILSKKVLSEFNFHHKHETVKMKKEIMENKQSIPLLVST